MLDMKIEDMMSVEECHRFLILELWNMEGKFSLEFTHEDEKYSSYCSKCGINKICKLDPETNSPYCSDICLKTFRCPEMECISLTRDMSNVINLDTLD